MSTTGRDSQGGKGDIPRRSWERNIFGLKEKRNPILKCLPLHPWRILGMCLFPSPTPYWCLSCLGYRVGFSRLERLDTKCQSLDFTEKPLRRETRSCFIEALCISRVLEITDIISLERETRSKRERQTADQMSTKHNERVGSAHGSLLPWLLAMPQSWSASLRRTHGRAGRRKRCQAISKQPSPCTRSAL